MFIFTDIHIYVQAAFCRLFNSLGVCEQKPLRLEDIPGDFNFCISTPLTSYQISENKNAKPLFVKLNSPFSAVISASIFNLPSMYI